MNNKTTVNELARALGALRRCEEYAARGTGDYSGAIASHEARIARIMEEAPRGSGLDAGGLLLDVDASTGEKLVFTAEFHHMDECGGYDGWTSHKIIVTPSLEIGFHLRITGRDRNDIKSYLLDVVAAFLDAEAPAQGK